MNIRRQPDASALALRWGMLWGAALGVWILMPGFLTAHHVRFEYIHQRVVLMIALAATFAALGGILALVGGFLLAVIEACLGSFRERRWAYALGTPVLLAAGYSLESVFIYWINFRSLDVLSTRWFSMSAVVVCAGALAAVRAYRWLTSTSRPLSTTGLAMALAGATGIGVVVATARGESIPPPLEHAVEALRPLREVEDVPPLLLLGIDGASWRLLQPEIQSRAAPTLRRLIDEGAHGTMEALWPPFWSGASWAAILTGLPRDITGVHEDLAARAPALPPFQFPITSSLLLNPIYAVRSILVEAGMLEVMLPPRSMLHGTPVWEWLHEAGVDTAVVRFRFTHPPAGQASLVISDRVGYDGWDSLGVRRDPVANAVTPPERANDLLVPFRPETPANRTLLDELLPAKDRHRPAGLLMDPVEALQVAADIDDRTFDASERILQSAPEQPFLGIYIAGLDRTEHAFWPYSFPGDYATRRPEPSDVARLGAVLPRYVKYLDRRLDRLLRLYKRPPNVLIVSDHGHGAAVVTGQWPGWHTKDAIVLASGPSVPRIATPLRVSYFDVVPTVLALQGFDRPSSLKGHSFLPTPKARVSD